MLRSIKSYSFFYSAFERVPIPDCSLPPCKRSISYTELIEEYFWQVILGGSCSQADRLAIYRRSSWDCIVCNERKVVMRRIFITVVR
jgi:hypothetical protein